MRKQRENVPCNGVFGDRHGGLEYWLNYLKKIFSVIARCEAANQPRKPFVTQSKARQSKKAAFSLAEAMSGFYRCVAAARTHFVSKIMEWNTCLSKYVAEYQFLRTCNNPRHGFSLAEAMITLLMVSIILSALAPIMTKKMRLTQTGFSTDGGYKYKQELTTIGSGTWSVPSGLQELAVTIIGAGGGGGAGLSSGEKEWTTPGTYNWTVPNGVTEIEATLVSGGAGGGAGNVIKEQKGFNGNVDWTPPADVVGKKVLVTMCGAGGGGGGAGSWGPASWVTNGASGGAGAEILREPVTIPNSNSIKIVAWGGVSGTPSGGGAGGIGGYDNAGNAGNGGSGGSNAGGGGGGGTGEWNANSGCNGNYNTSDYSWGGCPGIGNANGGTGGIAGQAGYGGGAASNSGGGGGAGGGASMFGSYLTAAGGGGGGGGGACNTDCSDRSTGGGGGGGGAAGGGDGGRGYHRFDWCNGGGLGGLNKNGVRANSGSTVCYNSNYFAYGGVKTIPDSLIPAGYCRGGDGGWFASTSDPKPGTNGGNAYVTLEYALAGNGGSGGGGGAIVPSQKVKVTPGETLTIIVGAGGTGGTAGSINSSGTIANPTNGTMPTKSKLLRSTNIVIQSGGSIGRNDDWHLPYPGGPTGVVAIDGVISRPGAINEGISEAWSHNWNGSQNTHGNAAGNFTPPQPGPFANGTVGGDGGVTSIDGANFDYSKLPSGWCKVAKGGTSSSRNGQSASGFGGCGGGGGYGLGAGGNGAGGYARIRWNRNQQGAGGGGGSSNVIYRKLINIQSATGTIPYIIGDGGIGGGTTFSTSTYRFNDGGQGEATSFGAGAAKLEVKGGLGGQSSYSTTAGTTGDAVTTTYYGGAGGALLDKSQCLFGSTITICYGSAAGTAGTNTNTSVGGIGANLEYKNTVYGKGGSGSSTGDGQAGDLFGSGGGGGGVKADTNTKGGKGAPGKIILEWK